MSRSDMVGDADERDERLRTRFALQRDVSSLLASTDDLREACEKLLALIGGALDYDFGTFWLRSSESGVIEPVNVWHRDDERLRRFGDVTRMTTFEVGEGMPGRVVESGEPQWIRDVRTDPNYSRAKAATAAGLRSSFSFPIMVRGVAEGALDFSSRQLTEPDQPLLDLMNSIGHQLGQFITMRRLELDQEERLRKIVSTVPGVVWEAWGEPDAESQKMNFVSDYVQEMLGYSVEEWLAEPNFWLKIVHPDDREAAARQAAEKFRDGGGRNSFRWVRKDGESIWVEAQSVTIYEDGQPVGMRGVTMDVTQRIRSQERNEMLLQAGAAMAKSLDPQETLEEVARQVVFSMADWCVIDLLDDDGEIRRLAVQHVDPRKVELARELERRYPQRSDAEVGVPQVLRTGEAEIVAQIPDSALRSMTQDEEHYNLVRNLGLSSYMILPMIARGRVIGAITFVTAESKRRYGSEDLAFGQMLARRAALAVDNARLYRAATLASQAKDEFLATLSHELRTPMTSILGWSRMLQLEGLAEEMKREAVETIARSAEAQSQIIDDVLDVSRIVTGKMRLHLEPVDLNQIIRGALQTIEPAASAKSISIRTQLEEVPETRADPARIQQVLWNLLSNAIKFTPRYGWIELRSHSKESSIVIEVQDSGAGMEKEFLVHAFERFQQAESTTTRQYGGLGLGLSIVRHLVELHGGEVRAFSEGKDMGSLFVVELPVAAVRAATAEHTTAPAGHHGEASHSELPDLRHWTVLIVDDERDARRLVSAVLERCGATVHSASSVGEAITMLDHMSPDVIVSDIGMPAEDGYDFIRKLKQRPGAMPPIIALTAYGRAEDQKTILDAGFSTYLRKPIHPRDLGQAVRDVLE